MVRVWTDLRSIGGCESCRRLGVGNLPHVWPRAISGLIVSGRFVIGGVPAFRTRERAASPAPLKTHSTQDLSC